MMLRKRTLWTLALVLATPAWSVRADEPKRKMQPKPPVAEVAEALDAGNRPAAATIEKIMAQAVRNIAARYNLNDVQTAEKSKLMKREVHRFLQDHEAEVWPAIRDLLAARLGLEPPESQEDVKRIGKTARPLAELAEKAIFRANEEWRMILTPEQKKMHDFDLAEMEDTFEQIDKNFASWEEGRAPQGPIFPQPKIAGGPSRPPRPNDGELPPPHVEVFNPTSIFEVLVEEFIKEYGLDEGQVTSARSILEEFKVKANDFQQDNKHELARIALRHQQAHAERDLKAVNKARVDRKELLKPVYVLCDEMDGRLRGLLTTAQIQRHDEKSAGSKTAKEKPTVKKRTSPSKVAKPKEQAAESGSKAQSDKG
jgi:hypothetical protein